MLNLANCYEYQQRYILAIKWYEFVLKIDKERYEAYVGLALCYLKDGSLKEALNCAD